MEDAVSSDRITVLCNGKRMQFPTHSTVDTVISYLGRDRYPHAVFLNEEYLPGDRSSHTVLRDGDTLKIIFFMGGG